jgi:hypothetical protein
MDIPYFYVDTPYNEDYKYKGICVKLGDEVVSRQCSDDIKEDARKTGAFAAEQGYSNWMNSSSIDNYPHDLAEEQGLDPAEHPDYCLRELITEGYRQWLTDQETP